ncbi:hypothetical protein [Microlunatus endophyticus]|nr:hypothetical protein [Microlunatus endophyticus]
MENSEILCACMNRPLECSFWCEVVGRYEGLLDPDTRRFMQETNRRVMPVRNYRSWLQTLRLPLNKTMQWYCTEVSRLYLAVGAAAESAGSHLVVDSSKHPFFYGLARASGGFEAFEHTPAIRLVRDPRGVLYSLARPKAQVTTQGAVTQMVAHGGIRGIRYWWAMNSAADRVVPIGTPMIRYEDLGSDAVAYLMARWGYREQPAVELTRHQLVANPVRQQGTRTFQLDARWQAAGLPWRTGVATMLRPWMRRYGYLDKPQSELDRP